MKCKEDKVMKKMKERNVWARQDWCVFEWENRSEIKEKKREWFVWKYDLIKFVPNGGKRAVQREKAAAQQLRGNEWIKKRNTNVHIYNKENQTKPIIIILVVIKNNIPR